MILLDKIWLYAGVLLRGGSEIRRSKGQWERSWRLYSGVFLIHWLTKCLLAMAVRWQCEAESKGSFFFFKNYLLVSIFLYYLIFIVTMFSFITCLIFWGLSNKSLQLYTSETETVLWLYYFLWKENTSFSNYKICTKLQHSRKIQLKSQLNYKCNWIF